MKTKPETRTARVWEFSVDSDWITTLGMLLLFFICGWLLLREIRDFIWGHLTVRAHFHKGFWSIWNKVFEVIAAVCWFMFALRFPKKSAKLGCTLMGIYLFGWVLLSCLQLSSSVQRIAATSASILWQIALGVLCVAIADWFRSVVQRGRPSDVRGGDV